MTLAELQQALRSVETAAVLVAPRVLENIIRKAGKISGWTWHVPHRQSYIVDRQTLFRHVEQEELALGADQLLPMTVILLAWPEPEEFEGANDAKVLLAYWQRLMHASVHLLLENRCAEGTLTPADIRARVEQLGPTRFAEVRSVLVQDHYLPDEPDERSVYIEFAAVFLELRYFAPHLLSTYFPTIRDPEEVFASLDQDVAAEALYQRTKPAGAAEPARVASSSQEAHEYYWELVRSSEKAAQEGNAVLAAIQRQRAARLAPAALAYDTRQEAIDELMGLVERLRKALPLSLPETEEWRKHLPALLDKADQGSRPVEAALLFDLQQVCLDYEREIYAMDLVEWLLSAGKRPIQRPLPSQRAVRVARTLRGTLQRLTMARLSDQDRNQFAALLQAAVQRSEDHVRERFRPLLVSALQDVGLRPSNPLESTALFKVVEELLDRILNSGFLTFSELRDTLSRNQLKLPDLSDPQDFIRGDPLLRLDTRLARLLDGVYRPSEFYLRWLERFTAVNFGTPLGRLLTLFVTVPFIGGFVILEAIKILASTAAKVVNWLVPISEPPLIAEMREWTGTYAAEIEYVSWGSLAIFLLFLIHSNRFRQRCWEFGAAMARPLRTFLVDGPLWVVQHTSLKEFISGWPIQLAYWYMLKPVLLAALVAIFLPEAYQTLFVVGLVFLMSMFFVNSRPGQAVGEAVAHVMTHFFELLRAGLVPGLINIVSRLFKQILHVGEGLLFSVDEWLRFRGGESRSAMVLRVLLSLLWFPIAYVIRFNMVVLIEPGINPLKFPIASVATKLMFPMLNVIKETLLGALTPVFGDVSSWMLTVYLIFWLPDVVAFIVWEMKENWSLYRANRRQTLRAVSLGSHGETVRSLVMPGFHSGTVPKLFARLREAERSAGRTGIWSGVRWCQSALADVEAAVHVFVAREFCELLEQSPAWPGKGPRVSRVRLATNQIRVELTHADHPDQPLSLEFEARGTALLACIHSPDWLVAVPSDQRILLTNALIRLCKLAGVDVMNERSERGGLGCSVPHFGEIDITWEQCVQCWQVEPNAAPRPLLTAELEIESPRTPPDESADSANLHAIKEGSPIS